MRLLYLYTEFRNEDGSPRLYRGFYHWEFNFSTDRVFHYDSQKDELTVEERKVKLPDIFWSENIYNITAIVGDNGSGKTTIMHYMMDLFHQIYQGRIRNQDKNMIIIEDESGVKLFRLPGIKKNYKVNRHAPTSKRTTINKSLLGAFEMPESMLPNRRQTFKVKPGGQKEIFSGKSSLLKDMFKTLKLIYLSNTLDVTDYRRLGSELEGTSQHFNKNGFVHSEMKKNFLCDCSTCGLILSDLNNDLRIDIRQNRDMSGISWLNIFFDYEHYKQVKYVFDKKQLDILKELRQQGYKVPVPERLYLQMESADYEVLGESFKREKSMIEEKELFPIAVQIMNNWFRMEGNHRIEELFFADLLTFKLCSNCVLSLLKSIRNTLYYQEYESLIERLKSIEKGKDERAEFEFSKNEFIEVVKEAVNFCTKFEDNEIKIICSHARCYVEFIEYIFAERKGFMNHFHMETAFDEILLDNRRPLEFSISTMDSEWFCNFLKIYRDICNPYYFLNFSWGLSSGESNLLRLFSSFYYLFDRDYKIQNQMFDGENFKSISCDSVFIFMDEADLTYHPEWQRRFIDILNAFLPKLYPEFCCKDIQIILSTHSPLLLGDMPQNNVVYLRTNEETGVKSIDDSGKIETFGQNIHLLFKEGFFLEKGTIGEFAGKKIKEVITELEYVRDFLRHEQTIYEGTLDSYLDRLHRCTEFVQIISAGIVREKLREMIAEYKGELEQLKKKEQTNGMSDKELEDLIKKLQNELDGRRKHDKN